MDKKIILLTGGSSGIGFETARKLVSEGHTVYAAARRTELMAALEPLGIDVVLVESSGIKTDWGKIAADHLSESSKGTAYEPTAEKEAALMRYAYGSNILSGPSAVMRSICKAVRAKRPRLRYRPGMGACTLIGLHAVLPARWWDALNRAFCSIEIK